MASYPPMREPLTARRCRAGGRRGRDDRRRHRRDRAAAGAALRAGLARLLPANLVAAPVVAPVMWLGMLAPPSAQLDARLAVPLNLSARRCSATWSGSPTSPLGAARRPCPGSPAAASLPLGRLPRRSPAPAGAAPPACAAARRRPPAPVLGCSPAPSSPWRSLAGRAPRACAPAARRHVPRRRPGRRDAAPARRASVLVDTGPPGGPILARLARPACSGSTLLVLTHAQADHEGVALAVRRHPTRLVLDGGAGWPAAVQREPRGGGARGGRRVGSATARRCASAMALDVLWPPAPPPGWRPGATPTTAPSSRTSAPARSTCCCRPTPSRTSPRRSPLPRVEALKVAHHGSDDPGLPALLERLRPAVAAIEVGRGTPYGHPTPPTLQALAVVPNVHAHRPRRDGAPHACRVGG